MIPKKSSQSRPLSASTATAQRRVTYSSSSSTPTVGGLSQESLPAASMTSTSSATKALSAPADATLGGGEGRKLFEMIAPRRHHATFRSYGIVAKAAVDVKPAEPGASDPTASTSDSPAPPKAVCTPASPSAPDASAAALCSTTTPSRPHAQRSAVPPPPESCSVTASGGLVVGLKEMATAPASASPRSHTADGPLHRPPPPSAAAATAHSRSTSLLAQHFPSVGHYHCVCGTPLFPASGKCASLGGHPCFYVCFGPALRLDLTLPSSQWHCMHDEAHFRASCANCGNFVGKVPLSRVDVDARLPPAGAARHRSIPLAGDGDTSLSDTSAHVCRVHAKEGTLLYSGSRAPPEYARWEVALLAEQGDDDGHSQGLVVDRRLSSLRSSRSVGPSTTTDALPSQTSTEAPSLQHRRPSLIVVSHRKSESDPDDDSDGSESDDNEEADVELWCRMRRDVRQRRPPPTPPEKVTRSSNEGK